ncbi:MAG TPA: SNF2-related protein [Candidatus Acidoferrales bacterium]|nr:SNF2-related protein [Candidatus Acidoferrales bacterium]
MAPPHPIHRRYLAEQLVRLRRADEQQRYAAAQRQGRIDPNPHQIDAVIFALKRIPEGGCILADEVGLGKTIEAGLVIAQLRAEGAATRVLLVVPKPLLGQWQDELYRLFGIQAVEGPMAPDGFSGQGVFLVGREAAGGERGSAILRDTEPFDLCIIDEAHEVFANIYRRFDKYGNYRSDSAEAQTADRVRSFLRQSPVLLLTATPIQNNLTELWGLVQYVEPTGTLLGTLRTFRDVFCDGDDRTLVQGQDQELRRRLEIVVQRTLRRQAQEFLERPFVARHAQIFEYSMTPREKSLYDDVTSYLLDPQILAFRGNQRRLLLIGFHRLMGSSIKALASSLRKVAERLNSMLLGRLETPATLLNDLDDADGVEEDADAEAAPEPEESELPDPQVVEAELERVRGFIARADTLLRDSKAEKLIDVMRVIGERPPERRRVVIFTESLVTQAYLRDLLIERGDLLPEDITLFRGTNDSARATAALQHWQQEVGDKLPPHQRPSRSVAVRLALVHEFKTRSRAFISTEAGAKGLNLQFCDTIVNYDLPWNPQRIEQRIGRCHRYGQQHDVTVVNFLAADNEAQRLTFEILSRKLDLFGKVLDASDVVLHEPSTDTPETLAGTLGSDFEGRLRRIYERARTVDEIESELRRLREEMDEERKRFEQTWARTAGLIETRFDQRVREVFRKLQTDLPKGLASLDNEIDQLITGFLRVCGVGYQRIPGQGHIRFELSPSGHLPDGWREGGTVAVGDAKELRDADPLHLGHALVQAAVEEARTATQKRLCVAWTIEASAPPSLGRYKGRAGRLVVSKVRYEGFERVDRLIPIAMLEGEESPLDPDCTRWLLDQAPQDRAAPNLSANLEDMLDDAIEEAVFVDQADVACQEQQRFERNLEQIERYVEDQVLALRRRLGVAADALRVAEDKRDTALGSEVRGQAEDRIRKVQEEIDGLESELLQLQDRHDPEYEKWREHAHRRRYRPPSTTRILDVEFILE